MSTVVKASFKGGYGIDRNNFKNEVCFLPISVGMLNHEGDKFKATLDLINRNFKRCVIQIDDTIQRHTLRITENITDKEAFEKTKLLGDEWLKRNAAKIESLDIDYEIIRWYRWTEDEDYRHYANTIEKSYSHDICYRHAIDMNVQDFLARRASRYKDSRYLSDKARKLCLEYLKEECAVMLRWADEGFDIELYPTGRNKAMEMTYETLIEPCKPKILKPVELRFKKHGNMNPLSNKSKRLVSLDELSTAIGV